MRQCHSCSKPLDRRNTSGVCKVCQPVTGAAASRLPKIEQGINGTVVSGRDAVVTKVTSEEVKTLSDLIRVCEIDIATWDIKRHEIQTRVTNDKTSYTIKAFLVQRVAALSAQDEIADLKRLAKEGLKNWTFPAYPRQDVDTDGGYMLEIPVTDPHFGKLAWGEETGDQNYDMKVATERFEDSINALLRRTAMFSFEQICLVLGGDLFHVDGKNNMTTGGTSVDADGRQQKTFRAVRTLMIRTIERLRQIAPVKVIMVTGNHDRESLWYLGDSLECWYHDRPGVEVENEPTSRKYHQFGKVMLMFTHGDKGRKEDYPLLMATEKPEMFGQTRFREVHTGHLHQTRTIEKHGVRVRVLPALCASDAWHSENGMVGNIQGAEAYVWSKDEGLVSQAYYTVEG